MRRKKDDKRVLIPRNNRPPAHQRQRRSRNTRNRGARKKKTNGITLFLMIIALVAFVIGAGVGISLSLDDGSDDGPHFENVTKEMTTNLNDAEPIYFDEEEDNIDFNDEYELSELNVTVEPSY